MEIDIINHDELKKVAKADIIESLQKGKYKFVKKACNGVGWNKGGIEDYEVQALLIVESFFYEDKIEIPITIIRKALRSWEAVEEVKNEIERLVQSKDECEAILSDCYTTLAKYDPNRKNVADYVYNEFFVYFLKYISYANFNSPGIEFYGYSDESIRALKKVAHIPGYIRHPMLTQRIDIKFSMVLLEGCDDIKSLRNQAKKLFQEKVGSKLSYEICSDSKEMIIEVITTNHKKDKYAWLRAMGIQGYERT